MPESQGDVHLEGTESEDLEVNHDLFKGVIFVLHESITKNFSRQNLIQDIEVRRESLDLIRLIIDSFSSVEIRRNCTG